MKVLVLQIRLADDPMLAHEQQCFEKVAGAACEQVDFFNVAVQPLPGALFEGYKALLVGGAGHFSLSGPDEPFYGSLFDFFRETVERSFPIFASCFGFHLLATALGGKISRNADCSEVGSFAVHRTDEGRRDALFSTLPDSFIVQQGHLDHAETLPSGVVHLATSDRCRYQGLRIPGKPIWATQFHPELDQEANDVRYQAYAEKYDPAAENDEMPEYTSLPSPKASMLIPEFLQLVQRS